MLDAIPTESRTHRCIDCPFQVEHAESEICTSCGRCALHCYDPAHHHPPETQLPPAPARRSLKRGDDA